MKPKRKKPKTHQDIEKSRTQTDFSFTVTKMAVSQICKSVGFKGTQFSALETLTQITTRYLQTLAKSAVSFCNASNRTQPNLLDLINALHDLSSIQGFPGASTLDSNNNNNNNSNCLLESSVLKGICSFVDSTDEIPFAKPIPRKELSSWKWELNSSSRGLHIPEWLPEFPDESTYNDEKRRRNDGEKLWEESDSVVKKCGESESESESGGRFEDNDDERKNGDGDLAVERGRVRFKIGGKDKGGVKVRNGMCRGGKRVCWNGGSSHKSDGVGENHEKRSGFKRKR